MSAQRTFNMLGSKTLNFCWPPHMHFTDSAEHERRLVRLDLPDFVIFISGQTNNKQATRCPPRTWELLLELHTVTRYFFPPELPKVIVINSVFMDVWQFSVHCIVLTWKIKGNYSLYSTSNTWLHLKKKAKSKLYTYKCAKVKVKIWIKKGIAVS